jgi:hypothetical protein
MKKACLIVTCLCLMGLFAPGAFAAKGKKGKASQTTPSNVYAKYDKNANGILDADEKEEIRKNLADDGFVQACDTNNDGKLSDDEIAAIPATKAAAKPAKKKQKK